MGVLGRPDGSSAWHVCYLSLSSTQNIADATWEPISWNDENYDPENWRVAGAPSRLTPDGYTGQVFFLVVVMTSWAASATGRRHTRILKNGTDMLAQSSVQPIAGSNTEHYTVGLARLAP